MRNTFVRSNDALTETRYFLVVDVVGALTDSVNPHDYWFRMKVSIRSEVELELSTICRQLKMKTSDGKMRDTDCADVKGKNIFKPYITSSESTQFMNDSFKSLK